VHHAKAETFPAGSRSYSPKRSVLRQTSRFGWVEHACVACRKYMTPYAKAALIDD